MRQHDWIGGGPNAGAEGTSSTPLPIVAPGAVIHAQVRARDRANPGGFLPSDGLEIAVSP
jgi:hypothetical protein